jgi:hypothetical protein
LSGSPDSVRPTGQHDRGFAELRLATDLRWPRGMRAIALISVLSLVGCAAAAPCHDGPAEILARHHLHGVTVELPAAEAAAQEQQWGGLCMAGALDRAVGDFLASTDDVEAPLAIAQVVPPVPPCPQPEPVERLRCYLGAGATLGLVAAADGDYDYLADTWLFYLEAPALSDHVFWAAVDRHDGSVAVHGQN